MKYQDTGRFGRITKNLVKKGYENEMENILYDSIEFNKLKKPAQTEYIEIIMDRMVKLIGQDNTNEVLFSCGVQCCGKSWSNFAKRIWKSSESIDDFFKNLNREEEEYDTQISYNSLKRLITVTRTKCICGLINKGQQFQNNKSYCNCSIGHMSAFFNSVFSVRNIKLEKTIFNGADRCEWSIELHE